jgi:uncharacterized delta-60 repeat protein
MQTSPKIQIFTKDFSAAPRVRRALAIFFTLPLLLMLVTMTGDTAQMQSTQDEFNPNANNSVLALVQQSDGNIVMGGQFTTVFGQTRNFIARVNSEGTLDATFNPSANNFVQRMALQPDDKILIGGTFTAIGGAARNRMARLNADGTLDAAFDANLVGSAVFSFAVQPDNKIIVGGLFSSVGGATRNNIARLNADGTLDTAFDPNADFRVQAIVVQPDGKIVISGAFTSVGGVARANIARLNSDGTLDTAFDPNASTTVGALALQPDGKILIGGQFASVGGVARSRIARLNADGTVDTGFDPNAGGGVFGFIVEADGRILVVGSFSNIGGQPRTGIARLTANGLADPSLNPNVNSSVGTLIVQADGKIVIGGPFTAVNGVTRNRIARFPAPEPTDITAPNNPVRPVSNNQNDVSNSPGGEEVANAIDNTTTKYLNFNSTNSGFIVTPNACSSVVQGLRIYTANDSPMRDPASYRLEGSTDNGATFTLISEGALALPEGRNPSGQPITAENLFSQTVLFSNTVSYRTYRLIFPTIKDASCRRLGANRRSGIARHAQRQRSAFRRLRRGCRPRTRPPRRASTSPSPLTRA